MSMCVSVHMCVCLWMCVSGMYSVYNNMQYTHKSYLLQLLMHIQCNHSDNIIENTIV